VVVRSAVLSVIVAVVDGGAALERCLSALLTQDDPPPMEVLVPYDSTIAHVADKAAAFPAVRFLDIGRLQTSDPPTNATGKHELIDRRRAGGLAVARGEFVAMVEDRGVPRADWAASVVRLHRDHPNAVIGGAVENGRDRLLNWTVYFCDFGRYQLPFEEGVRRYVSDVNVSYKMRALEQTRSIWHPRYHEPLVHWALERAGETLLLSPDMVVEEIRDDLTLSGLLAERYAWGRLFGRLRGKNASVVRRVSLTAVAPFVPLVLFARFVRDQMVKRAPVGRLVAVAPLMLLLSCAWAAGEAAGTVGGQSETPRR
jgi:hypothetical protein